MKVWSITPALVLLGVATIACEGAHADVTVTIRDDAITTSERSLTPGEVTFEGVNEGTATHEFEILRVPEGVDANALPMDGTTARADDLLVPVDEVEDIAPGTSATLSVELEPGTYAVICNLPGHYANGMHTTFTVA